MFEQSTMLIFEERENPQLNCLLQTIESQFCPNFILKSPSIVLSISQLSNIAHMSGLRCDRCCGQVRVFPHHGPAVEEEQEPQPRNIRLLPRGGPQQKLRLQVGSRGQEWRYQTVVCSCVYYQRRFWSIVIYVLRCCLRRSLILPLFC